MQIMHSITGSNPNIAFGVRSVNIRAVDALTIIHNQVQNIDDVNERNDLLGLCAKIQDVPWVKSTEQAREKILASYPELEKIPDTLDIKC